MLGNVTTMGYTHYDDNQHKCVSEYDEDGVVKILSNSEGDDSDISTNNLTVELPENHSTK